MSAAKAKKSDGAARGTSAKQKDASGSGASTRVGRGTRWTEEQVTLLLDTVKGSSTAKDAFETVARKLGKSTGTVQQKYYNLQKQRSGAPTRPRTKAGAAAGPRGRGSSARTTTGTRGPAGDLPSAGDLRALTVDELVTLATRVRGEVDRRRQELDAASKLLAG